MKKLNLKSFSLEGQILSWELLMKIKGGDHANGTGIPPDGQFRG